MSETSNPASAGKSRLVDSLTHQLRGMILRHEILPGERILQSEWAARLGVSRTPLREALRVLERDGLVAARDGNRTVAVTTYDSAELRDMYQIREAVDGIAAGLLAQRPESVEERKQLDSCLGRMRAASDPFDPAAWFEAHTDFHLAITSGCGNSVIAAMDVLVRTTSMSLHAAMVDVPADQLDVEHILRLSDRHHTDIVSAIRDGEAARADDMARKHIRSTLKSGLIQRAAEQTTQA